MSLRRTTGRRSLENGRAIGGAGFEGRRPGEDEALQSARCATIRLPSTRVRYSTTALAVHSSPTKSHLPAIWCFCKSAEYHRTVRRIDQKLNVTNGYLGQGSLRPRTLAAESPPRNTPTASRNPTATTPRQWLFKGHPKGSTDPLQVAVARLLGYRWPDQEPDDLDAMADKDGIVPIPAYGASRPPPIDCVRSCEPPSGRNGLRRAGQAADRGRGQAGHVARRLAPQQLLRAALQAVPPPSLHLAHLGRTQGRLCLPGELPQARPRTARNPDVLLPPGLDQRPGRRGEGEQDGGRSSPQRRPGVAGEA